MAHRKACCSAPRPLGLVGRLGAGWNVPPLPQSPLGTGVRSTAWGPSPRPPTRPGRWSRNG
eukprot:2009315-Lingulodinium_polyedra.AAC.1